MTESVREKTSIKRSEVYEDYDEYIYLVRYLKLARESFCCKEMYEILLGENDGRCELHFGYIPQFREYFIDVRAEYGGAIQLIKHCPWCGSRLPKRLREEFFNTLEKEYNIETDIGECKEREDIPQEFKSDEWWKKRKL